jgi:hypothetical protein
VSWRCPGVSAAYFFVFVAFDWFSLVVPFMRLWFVVRGPPMLRFLCLDFLVLLV